MCLFSHVSPQRTVQMPKNLQKKGVISFAQVPWDWPMLGMLRNGTDLDIEPNIRRHFFQKKNWKTRLAFESLVLQQQFCVFFC